MLGQRRRRWTNIETELGECLVFAGCVLARIFHTHYHHTAAHMIAARGGSKLANYQACVLTGHSIPKSEMTMSFCQAFLSKLLGRPYIHSVRKAISPYLPLQARGCGAGDSMKWLVCLQQNFVRLSRFAYATFNVTKISIWRVYTKFKWRQFEYHSAIQSLKHLI